MNDIFNFDIVKYFQQRCFLVMMSISSVTVLLLVIQTSILCEELILNEEDIPGFQYVNQSADPCDDFYQFTCGNFKTFHPRPKRDMSVSDSFELLKDDLTKLVSEILSTKISDDDPDAVKKAKMAYDACVHSYYSDDLGLEVPELRIIRDAGGMPLLEFENGGENSKFDWNEAGELVAKYGIPILFKIDVVNPFGLENSIFLTNDGGLQLPNFIIEDRDRGYDRILDKALYEYANKLFVTASSAPEPFDVFLEAIVTRLRNVVNPQMTDEVLFEELDDVKKFMRQLYRGGDLDGVPTDDDLPDARITLGGLNNWTRTYFGEDINLDWVEFMKRNFKLAAVNITEDIVVVHNIGQQIYGTLNLIRHTRPSVVKNFMLLRLFLYLAPDSDRYMRNAFENYYRAKNYPLYSRSDYCARKISDATGYASLSFAVAHQYQKYFFDINKLSRATTMIEDIECAFKDSVLNSDWMDDITKKAALQKSENMLTLLAYPDVVEDEKWLNEFYENMRICHWDHYGNSQTIRAFQQAYAFSQIGKNKNRTFWNRSPFEVNAYYNRPNNRMTFPISMLNLLFFSNISVLDYGRIGSIIGHEITHGFDSEGRKYNQDGILVQWWSPSTLEAFMNKTQCFIKQYSKYHIEELNTQVDGNATLNENLADNGGLRNSFRAYQKMKARGEVLQSTSKFTSDQLFFIGFGTMWCTDASPAYLQNIPNYSPARYRVNGAVSNLEDFAKAFNCPVGSKMNPEKECVLW